VFSFWLGRGGLEEDIRRLVFGLDEEEIQFWGLFGLREA
jgi:hypothetical protein